jgi:hypothetical protein
MTTLTPAQEYERRVAIACTRECITDHESKAMLLTMAAMLSIRRRDEPEALRLKLEAAMDTFKQAYGLLRELVGKDDD